MSEPIHTHTIARDSSVYTVNYSHDYTASDPLPDAAHGEFGVYIVSDPSSFDRDYVHHCGRAGEALKHFIKRIGRNPDMVIRLYEKWAGVTKSPWRLFTGHAKGYSQGDYHTWYALVNVATGWGDGDTFNGEQLATAAQYTAATMQEYTWWAYGDTFGYEVIAPDGTEIDACWGFYGDPTTVGYWNDQIVAEIDAHYETVVADVNRVGAGFVGVI